MGPLLTVATYAEVVLLAAAAALAWRERSHRVLLPWLAALQAYELAYRAVIGPALLHAPRPLVGDARALAHAGQALYIASPLLMVFAAWAVFGRRRGRVVVPLALGAVAMTALVGAYPRVGSARILPFVFAACAMLNAAAMLAPGAWRAAWSGPARAAALTLAAFAAVDVARLLLPFAARPGAPWDLVPAIHLAAVAVALGAHVAAFRRRPAVTPPRAPAVATTPVVAERPAAIPSARDALEAATDALARRAAVALDLHVAPEVPPARTSVRPTLVVIQGGAALEPEHEEPSSYPRVAVRGEPTPPTLGATPGWLAAEAVARVRNPEVPEWAWLRAREIHGAQVDATPAAVECAARIAAVFFARG